jgi:hypothetical protein
MTLMQLLMLLQQLLLAFGFSPPDLLRRAVFKMDFKRPTHQGCIAKAPTLTSTSLSLFGWGENKDDKDRKKGQGLDSWLSDDPDQGNDANTASMMEQFKKSQQTGKRTASLMEDLASTTITGAWRRTRSAWYHCGFEFSCLFLSLIFWHFDPTFLLSQLYIFVGNHQINRVRTGWKSEGVCQWATASKGN